MISKSPFLFLVYILSIELVLYKWYNYNIYVKFVIDSKATIKFIGQSGRSVPTININLHIKIFKFINFPTEVGD